jgi:DNA-binding IclR family transcriptional regulator
MPRASPQTDRVVAVIELLTVHPDADFTLAELARRLGVSKPTCSPMLAALTRSGWLLRHPTRKTYRLGPALARAGQVAAAGTPVLDLARPGMVELAEQCRLACLGLAPSADALVVVELVPAPGPDRKAFGLRLGDRIPPHPPLGAVLVAWQGEEAMDVWLHGSRSPVPQARSSQYARDLAAIRERGYAVELRAPIQERVAWLADELRAAVRDGRATVDIHDLVDQAVGELADEDVLLTDIAPDRAYRPSSINAPVFDVDGSVALTVCLIDAAGPLSGAEIVAVGERVRDVTAEITRTLGGRPPRTFGAIRRVRR